MFSTGGGIAVCEGIVSLSGCPVLADPTWNCIVFGVAAVFQGLRWRVSRRELIRHRHLYLEFGALKQAARSAGPESREI